MKFENCAKTINKYQYCDKEARNIVHLLADIIQVFDFIHDQKIYNIDFNIYKKFYSANIVTGDEMNDMINALYIDLEIYDASITE